MKTKTIFAFATLSLVGLTACSNDKDFPKSEEANQEVCLHVDVNSLSTRASHADASTFDDFGISIASASGNQNYNWNNVKVTASDSGDNRTWKPTQSMSWKSGNQTINVLAFTPYNADAPDNLIKNKNFPISVSVQQGPTEYGSDFLVYKKSNFNPVIHNNNFKAIEVNFRHAMSQLNVNLTFKGYTDDAIKKATPIQLEGTIVEGICDFTQESTWVKTGNTQPKRITVNKSNTTVPTVSYSAILVPQTIKAGKLTIAFSIDGWNYIWTSTRDYTFVENTSYTLNITADDNKTTATAIQSRAWNNNR